MLISIHPAALFKRFGIDGGYKLMHENGIEGIQFGMGAYVMSRECINKKEPNVMDGTMEEIMEYVRPYKEAAEKYDVKFSQVHAPFPSYVPGDEEINARMQKVLIKTIEMTARLGCKQLVVHPPHRESVYDRVTLEEERRWVMEQYEPLIPHLKKHGVVCMLENLFNRGVEGERFACDCSDFPLAVQWMDELNEKAGEEVFGFCFDVGHCFLARQNVYRAVRILGHRLKSLHMQDNDGHVDMHIAPYAGYIDWAAFLDALKEVNYTGDLNFEAGNAISRYPAEMSDICVQLLSRTGQYFRNYLTAK